MNFNITKDVTEKEFTSEWVESLKSGRLKHFPEDFIDKNEQFEEIKLPPKNIHMGEELFGSFELIDSDGNSVLVADSHAKAKFIIYSSREKVQEINIPLKEQKVIDSVKSYEKYLDGLIREIEKDYNSKFPKLKNFLAVSNVIFNSLNLKRY